MFIKLVAVLHSNDDVDAAADTNDAGNNGGESYDGNTDDDDTNDSTIYNENSGW